MARVLFVVLVLSAAGSFVVSQMPSSTNAASSPDTSTMKTNSEAFTTSTAVSRNPSSPTKETDSPPAATSRDSPSSSEPRTSVSSTIHVNTTDPAGNTTSEPSSATALTLSSSLTTVVSSLTSATNVTEANEKISPNTEVVGDVAQSPGVVAVLCIFFIAVALLLTIGIAKAISSKKNKFEKLEDLPMNKMNEGSPFAQYPPK
ncbi:endochitinase A-like [Arapaima gigas]